MAPNAATHEPVLPCAPQRKRPVFDLRYALRVCTLEGRDRACVHIYSAMGLYEEAVELALSKVGVDLAKENASMPEDDEELQKKLWLRIAHHVIEKERNVEMYVPCACTRPGTPDSRHR